MDFLVFARFQIGQNYRLTAVGRNAPINRVNQHAASLRNARQRYVKSGFIKKEIPNRKHCNNRKEKQRRHSARYEKPRRNSTFFLFFLFLLGFFFGWCRRNVLIFGAFCFGQPNQRRSYGVIIAASAAAVIVLPVVVLRKFDVRLRHSPIGRFRILRRRIISFIKIRLVVLRHRVVRRGFAPIVGIWLGRKFIVSFLPIVRCVRIICTGNIRLRFIKIV